jgi:hypothetical protein
LILGEKVRSQRWGLSNPNRLFKGFKWDLAADYQPPARLLDNKTYTSASVAELLIKHIWQQVQQQNIKPSQVFLLFP